MVLPTLGRAAQAAARMGSAAAPALGQAVASATGAAARATVSEASRHAVAGLAPRATMSGCLASAMAPRGGAPGLLKKVAMEIAESAAADLFGQATGVSGPTSPSLGGLTYDLAKAAFAASGALDTGPAPRASAPASTGRLPLATAPPERSALAAGALPQGPFGGGSVVLQEFLKNAAAE